MQYSIHDIALFLDLHLVPFGEFNGSLPANFSDHRICCDVSNYGLQH